MRTVILASQYAYCALEDISNSNEMEDNEELVKHVLHLGMISIITTHCCSMFCVMSHVSSVWSDNWSRLQSCRKQGVEHGYQDKIRTATPKLWLDPLLPTDRYQTTVHNEIFMTTTGPKLCRSHFANLINGLQPKTSMSWLFRYLIP